MPPQKRTRAFKAAALLALSLPLQSCLSAALFSLPEPKNRQEEIRNNLGSAVLPAVMVVEIVTLPVVIPGSYIVGGVQAGAKALGGQSCEAKPTDGPTKDPDQ